MSEIDTVVVAWGKILKRSQELRSKEVSVALKRSSVTNRFTTSPPQDVAPWIRTYTMQYTYLPGARSPLCTLPMHVVLVRVSHLYVRCVHSLSFLFLFVLRSLTRLFFPRSPCYFFRFSFSHPFHLFGIYLALFLSFAHLRFLPPRVSFFTFFRLLASNNFTLLRARFMAQSVTLLLFFYALYYFFCGGVLIFCVIFSFIHFFYFLL